MPKSPATVRRSALIGTLFIAVFSCLITVGCVKVSDEYDTPKVSGTEASIEPRQEAILAREVFDKQYEKAVARAAELFTQRDQRQQYLRGYTAGYEAFIAEPSPVGTGGHVLTDDEPPAYAQGYTRGYKAAWLVAYGK